MASLSEDQFERFLVFAQPSARQDYGRLRRFLRAEAKRRPAQMTDRLPLTRAFEGSGEKPQ
jgi:hypothetical protein